MTMQIRAYRPLGNNKTVNLVVGTASTSLAVPDVPFGTRALRIANIGTQVVFIELTTGTAIAASLTTSVPLLPGSVEVFTLANDITHVATIAAATGSTLYITYGEGM